MRVPRGGLKRCFSRMGSCTAGKMQRILASVEISQHAKMNMAGFVLYLPTSFALRYRMVGVCPKNKKNEFPTGNVEGIEGIEIAMQNQRPFTTEDTKSTEENKIATKQRAEALVRRIGETCDELDRLAEENPELVRRVTRRAKEPKDAYLRLKARLQQADAMPRCRWIKQSGTTCGSPQMKNHIYCFAHTQMAEAQALALRLPPPEDANAIQVGLMRIQKALIEDTITTRKAGLLLYSMQLALTNVGQTTFGQAKDEELVLETVDEEEALSSQRAAFSENQNQQQNQRPFTAKDAEDAKENGERQNQNLFTTEDAEKAEGNGERQNQQQKQNQYQNETQTPLTAEDTENNQGLPLINSDDTDRKSLPRVHTDVRGVQRGIKQIEWKPTPGMYRMDTREGREAYEASCRVKIAARPCAEERAPQPGIAPAQERRGPGTPGIATNDRAEPYYSSRRDERLNSLRSPMPKDMGLGPRSASEPLDADTGAGSIVRTETHAVLG
jgi:hypothetical protein